MAKKKKEEAPKAVPAGKPSSLVDTRVICFGDNPWRRLPQEADFVLPEDKDLVNAFNSSAKGDLKLHLELLPEPFLGRPDAPVVLLNLNPGYRNHDLSWHRKPAFRIRSRSNLTHDPCDYPLYLLAPSVSFAPGHKWWKEKLRPLVEQTTIESVAQKVLCVEYFPYHSKHFGHAELRLPSQQYSFDLVRSAIDRGAVIICMQGNRFWSGAVPKLASYRRFYRVKNVRRPAISPKNCPEGFERAVKAICGG